MAVDIVTQPELLPRRPRMLFEGTYDIAPPYGRGYDISSRRTTLRANDAQLSRIRHRHNSTSSSTGSKSSNALSRWRTEMTLHSGCSTQPLRDYVSTWLGWDGGGLPGRTTNISVETLQSKFSPQGASGRIRPQRFERKPWLFRTQPPQYRNRF